MLSRLMGPYMAICLNERTKNAVFIAQLGHIYHWITRPHNVLVN